MQRYHPKKPALSQETTWSTYWSMANRLTRTLQFQFNNPAACLLFVTRNTSSAPCPKTELRSCVKGEVAVLASRP